MKKLFFSFFILFSMSAAFSFNASDITSFSLENGLKVFVLPDSSSATIRMELVVKAGFSFQNERNAGFFPLYAHLIGGVITADTVKIEKNSSPNDFSKILGELATCLENLRVSDFLLQKELDAMKATVSEYASSPSGFINTSIDARIFSSAPWKTESGVYPALFSKNDVTQSRIILDEISRNFYTADNSLLFISGNITLKKAESKTKRIFSHARISPLNDASTLREPQGPKQNLSNQKQKKFVIVDDELSSDMIQIVVQYLDFSKKECDAISKIFNEDFSTFKKDILADEEKLGIRGASYINAASSLTLDSSRLIIQSLLETTKTPPPEQAELFLKNATSYPEKKVTLSASRRIKKETEKEFARFKDESDLLMSLFSSWTIATESFDVEKFFENFGGFSDLSGEEIVAIVEKFETSSPYLFVLVNSSVHQKYKSAFSKKGYETVTRKNGSWYSQSLYEKIIKIASDERLETEKEKNESDDDVWKNFVESSKKSFSTFKLNNSIPVTIKQNENSATTAISILISGGELAFSENQMFLGSILTNAIANNIDHELYLREKSGALHGKFDVKATTDAISSLITITCQIEDAQSCLEAAGNAIVYKEVTPAMADRLIYNERNIQRIKAGSTEYQILCAAVGTIFKDSKLKKLYTTSDDILENVKYSEIARLYPMLLDANRYSIIITGATPPKSEISSVLNRTFGVLQKNSNAPNAPNAPEKEILKGDFTPVTKKIKVRHTFLTDISADKAGPRPLVLVPTKKFLDPALYVFKAPEGKKEKTLQEALLIEIATRFQKELGFQNTVKFSAATSSLPFSTITVTQIEKIAPIEQAYKRVVSKLSEELAELENVPLLVSEDGKLVRDGRKQILLDLENGWLTKNLSQTGSNTGTAKLIANGLKEGDAQLYLKEYENVATAQAEDYISVLKAWIPENLEIKFYSSDTR